MGFQLQELRLSKTIELQVLDNINTKIKFDLNETKMDNVLVHGISFLFNPNPLAVSPTNKPLFSFNDMLKGFLTLANNDNGIFNQSIPLELFYLDVSVFTLLHPKIVSIRNSFMEFPRIANAVVPAGGASVVCTLYYELFDPSKHQLNAMKELILNR